MEKVIDCKFKVPHVFGEQEVTVTLYKGLTFLLGANGTDKTQTLHSLRDFLQRQRKKVRYLSSNRIGLMEQYRSKCNQYSYNCSDFSFGGQAVKKHREEIETATGDFFTMDARREMCMHCWHVAQKDSALRYSLNTRMTHEAAYNRYRNELENIGIDSVSAFRRIIHSTQSLECHERRRRLERLGGKR